MSSSFKKTKRTRDILPGFRRLSILFLIVGLFVLYFPMLAVIVTSFQGSLSSSGAIVDQGWSLFWYRRLLEDEEVFLALKTSLSVALFSMLISTFLGTLAALALVRTRIRMRGFVEGLLLIPLVSPEIVLGVSLLSWLVLLGVTLGQLSIVLAHVTFTLSYVVLAVRSRVEAFDTSLEEAARDLGASSFQTFWRVTFPLIWPGILSGALIAFTLSFDDFLITFFTAGPGYETLPVTVYSMIKFGISREINALSSLIFGVTFLAVFLVMNPFSLAAGLHKKRKG